MRVPRVSLATVGFVVLVVALDLGMVRLAFGRENDTGVGCLFLLLPMLDALSIALYRVLTAGARGEPTRGAAGFLVAGSVATPLVVVASLRAPETTRGLFSAVTTPIALVLDWGLERLLGDAVTGSPAVQRILGVGFRLVLPMALFSLPPFLVALLGGWAGRRAGAKGTPGPPGAAP